LIRPTGVDPHSQETVMPKDHSESADAAQPEEAADQSDDAGLSRADRRAKARGKNPQAPAHGQPHFVPKNSQGGAKRNYSNRRAG